MFSNINFRNDKKNIKKFYLQHTFIFHLKKGDNLTDIDQVGNICRWSEIQSFVLVQKRINSRN